MFDGSVHPSEACLHSAQWGVYPVQSFMIDVVEGLGISQLAHPWSVHVVVPQSSSSSSGSGSGSSMHLMLQ